MWTPAHREKYKYDDRRYPSDLTDAEWEAIKVIFSGYTTLTVDLREMVNACFYLERTGCPWPYLPKDFGPWETVRWWYDRFRADGIWAEVSSHLTRAVRKAMRVSRRRGSRKVLSRLRKKATGDSTGTRRSRA